MQLVEWAEAPSITYRFECFDAAGNLKWAEAVHNLITTQGKNDILDKYLKGSGYTAAWFLGLKGEGSAAAGDTLASHGGWAEVSDYSGNRPAITWGSTAAGSNTANSISFVLTDDADIAGAFVCSAASGTSGILYSVVELSRVRELVATDQINISQTITMT